MKDLVPRVCVSCKVLRERERFPRMADGERGKLCQLCVDKALGPRHCKGCATLTKLEHYPLRRDGKPSSLCSACHLARAQKQCTKCKERKKSDEFFLYSNGSRSRTCNACRVQQVPKRECTRCKQTLPITAFRRYASNNFATCCEKCRRPNEQPKQKMHKAAHPCAACGGEIWRRLPPSRVATRKTCSRACASMVKQKKIRRCNRCNKNLPHTEFDRLAKGVNRKKSCRKCIEKDTKIIDGRPNLRLTLHHFRQNLYEYARRWGVGHNLGRHDVKALYDSPCQLCGNPVTTFVLRDKSLGVVRENCRPVCRSCRSLLYRFSWAELVLLANEIASRNNLQG